MSQEFLQPLFVFMQILVSFLLSYFKAVLLQAARSQREVGGSHGRKWRNSRTRWPRPRRQPAVKLVTPQPLWCPPLHRPPLPVPGQQVSHSFFFHLTSLMVSPVSFVLTVLELCKRCHEWFLQKGGQGCLMSPPCLESQGCHLIPLCCLLSRSSA